MSTEDPLPNHGEDLEVTISVIEVSTTESEEDSEETDLCPRLVSDLTTEPSTIFPTA